MTEPTEPYDGPLTIDTEREPSGRWLAEVASEAGVVAHGATRLEAIANATALFERVRADRRACSYVGRAEPPSDALNHAVLETARQLARLFGGLVNDRVQVVGHRLRDGTLSWTASGTTVANGTCEGGGPTARVALANLAAAAVAQARAMFNTLVRALPDATGGPTLDRPSLRDLTGMGLVELRRQGAHTVLLRRQVLPGGRAQVSWSFFDDRGEYPVQSGWADTLEAAEAELAQALAFQNRDRRPVTP